MPRAQSKPRLSIRYALLAALIFILGGCQFLSQKSTQPEIAKNPCLVLALPASGPYSQIASKIKRGADLARQELNRQGIMARIENINTEAPDWLTRLASLPEECAIVGGPLQDKSYLEARKAGLLSQRAFFAFVPTLAQGDEGRVAWRYFPSPQDQVESLIRFATEEMGMRTYGAFYPADNYGRRMTGIMEQALQKRHIPLQKAAYSPGASGTWAASAAPLINPKQEGNVAIPQTTFEALFLPDSFKNLDMITQSLLVNGEDRLALLGTTLWEQGLGGKQIPKAEKYSLAVFPGAWNKAKAPASLKNGDFWSALGYDFTNFGAAVALAARPESAIITSRAQAAAQTGRAMAPLRYDENGVAHQQMYLFQVTSAGMTPLDANRFRQARTAAAERAALRMQGLGNIDPVTGEAIETQPAVASESIGEPVQEAIQTVPEATQVTPVSAPAQPAAARPMQATPDQGIMSSAPRPSYKLSLPGRK